MSPTRTFAFATPVFRNTVPRMGREIGITYPPAWQLLREVFLSSGYSLRELETVSGIPKSRLDRILNGKSALTVPALQVLAVALDFDPRDVVSLGDRTTIDVLGANNEDPTIRSAEIMLKLLQRAKRQEAGAGRELTLDRVLGWYHATGGRLENADRILPYLSVFQPMASEDDKLEALYVGSKCLAYESLATTDPAAIRDYVDSLSADTRREILYSYFSTYAGQAYQIHSRKVEVSLPGRDRRYELNYATLLLPMTGTNGRDVIVNHSVLVSVRFLDPLPAAPKDSARSKLPAARTPPD